MSCALTRINFIHRVGMPLVMNVRNYLWFPTSLLKYCLALIFVCFLACLLLLQSDHSTEFRRGTIGSLNENLHSSIHAVFSINFLKNSGSQLVSSIFCWNAQQVSKNELQSIPNSTVPTTVRRLRLDQCSEAVSDKRRQRRGNVPRSWLYPATFQRLSPM